MHDRYWVYNPAGYGETESELALVLNDCTEDGVPGARIVQGDIIKIGRCKLIVKEIVEGITSQQVISEANSGAENSEAPNEYVKVAKEEYKRVCKLIEENTDSKVDDIKCRICLGEENKEENPLISSPCSCLGSVKYMHISCLQQWLKSQVTQRKTAIVSSYVWKEFKCDVCKANYPGKKSIRSRCNDPA